MLRKVLILTFICSIFTVQIINAKQPPAWSIGEWWIIDSQLYEMDRMNPDPSPHWGPVLSWKFFVEEQVEFEGEPHDIVSVSPYENNSFPYSFRIWYRSSDKYITRYELFHKFKGKSGRVIPPKVLKEFNPEESEPFFIDQFPMVPLNFPVFGDVNLQKIKGTASKKEKQYAPKYYKATQKKLKISAREVNKKAGKQFKKFFKRKYNIELLATLKNDQDLIQIDNGAGKKESQYWAKKLPWYVYGEKTDGLKILRRCWLIKTGSDNKKQGGGNHE